MNLYIQGEVNALTIIFSRILIDRPFDIIYTFDTIFNIRTKNIKIIEKSLKSSLYASILTCLELGININFTTAIYSIIKCSFESIIEIFNSVNFSHDFVIYFLKPIEFYTQKINLKLIVSIEGVYIQQETFYLYAEICCSNLWIKGILSNTFKELV